MHGAVFEIQQYVIFMVEYSTSVFPSVCSLLVPERKEFVIDAGEAPPDVLLTHLSSPAAKVNSYGKLTVLPLRNS